MNQQLQKIVQILRRKMQQESCWRKWLIQAWLLVGRVLYWKQQSHFLSYFAEQ
jgi:hypothetical protein